MDNTSIVAALIAGFLPGWVVRLSHRARNVPLVSTVLWLLSPQDPPPPSPPLLPPTPLPALAELQAAVLGGVQEGIAPMANDLRNLLQVMTQLNGRTYTLSIRGSIE